MKDANNKAAESAQTTESTKQEPFKVFESEEKLSEYLSDNLKAHEEKLKTKLESEIVQNVEIYYKMIGHVKLPQLSKKETENLSKSFGRIKEERSA